MAGLEREPHGRPAAGIALHLTLGPAEVGVVAADLHVALHAQQRNYRRLSQMNGSAFIVCKRAGNVFAVPNPAPNEY